MEDIIKFSNQLQGLIEENEILKDKLKRTEELLKLAICVTGSLNYRTIEKTDKDTYQYFIDNTVITNGGNSTGGMQLIWNKQIPVTFKNRTIMGLATVTMEEIDEIFNNSKVEHEVKKLECEHENCNVRLDGLTIGTVICSDCGYEREWDAY
jgi:hypothetical protein